jgi:hypothetical protein
MKIFLRKITLLSLVSLLSSFFLADIPGLSAAQHSSNSTLSKARFKFPRVRNGQPTTGRRRGAGSGSDCSASRGSDNDFQLVALVPTQTEETASGRKTHVWGITIANRPTFWFYVNYPSGSYGEFIFQDLGGNELYSSQPFQIGESPGVIGIQLPESAEPLRQGVFYQWYFKIYCGDPEQTSSDDYVRGWVERTSNLNPPSSPTVEYFSENGVWYDALTYSAHSSGRCISGVTPSASWSELLEQIGLSHLSQTPITQCEP